MNQFIHFSLSDINHLERFYRANLINSITGYKPANLIGTFSESGIANLAIFTSVVHLGANPPLLGFIQRPVGQFSHTYRNITRDQYYTINHVHNSFVKNAHYTSAKFDDQTSEFTVCQLKVERLLDFPAPFVGESRIKIGLKFVQDIPIKLNDTRLMVGQIEHLFIQPEAIRDDGSVDLNVVDDVCVTGLGNYHQVRQLHQFPYAKANDIPDFA